MSSLFNRFDFNPCIFSKANLMSHSLHVFTLPWELSCRTSYFLTFVLPVGFTTLFTFLSTIVLPVELFLAVLFLLVTRLAGLILRERPRFPLAVVLRSTDIERPRGSLTTEDASLLHTLVAVDWSRFAFDIDGSVGGSG